MKKTSDKVKAARCAHMLRILCRQHGPREATTNRVVPEKRFAAMSTTEVRADWDFADRFLMHAVAKVLTQK